MKRKMAMRFVSGLVLLASSCISTTRSEEIKKDNLAETQFTKLREHAHALKEFARSHKASTQLAILVDMSLPSWKKRMFTVNLQNDSVLISGICAHGQCDDYTKEDVKFSNVPGSNCTAQGRYRIGGKYSGQYGQAYKLFGLDSTNSNAFNRVIVYHYYSCVSDFEDSTVCRSNGCPMVSPNVFNETAKLLDASSRPVLMRSN